ncbi:MAG: WbqC family protein [Rikenellaceae bacterium]
MTILPSVYLPNIEYFAHIAQGACTIDLGENYIKRSARNRTRIMTASGVMELSVCVRNANRPRMPMGKIEIDYSKKWQHQHSLAILSAYKSSPFYDHYAPYFEPIFGAKYERLVDLNWALTELIIKLLGIKADLTISTEYVTAQEGDRDLRPKRREDVESFEHEPYIQVFYDREPFVANLSILDLLFNEGTAALSILINSKL